MSNFRICTKHIVSGLFFPRPGHSKNLILSMPWRESLWILPFNINFLMLYLCNMLIIIKRLYLWRIALQNRWCSVDQAWLRIILLVQVLDTLIIKWCVISNFNIHWWLRYIDRILIQLIIHCLDTYVFIFRIINYFGS